MLEDLIPESPHFLVSMVGLALLLGWGAGLLCRRLKVPMVVGYILVGILMGKSVLGIFNDQNFGGLVYFTYLALACIGFDIGGELAFRKLRHLGNSILWISVLESLGATVLVTLAIYIFFRDLPLALVFGALASATAPAATVDVLREYQSSGPLTTTVFAVVGIDDAVAIIIYAFAIFLAKFLLAGSEVHVAEAVLRPFGEILGALALGTAIGLVFLFLVRNYTARRGLLVLTLGAIVLVTGLANALHLSLILANMAMGMAVVNLTKWRREDLFEIMRGITQPLFVIFFVVVGSQLMAGKLLELGWIGLLYILFRSLGKQAGASLGGTVSKAPESVRKYLGLCLFSQAGVAIGLSIQTMLELGGGNFGAAGVELGTRALSVIAATTLFFQIIGPPLTRYAIFKAGEARV
ncbi:MAG: cation:proton antiporter [Actinobacteria bacterium]|nr:cation:proton antiporter [Actinomycetota bacterium]